MNESALKYKKALLEKMFESIEKDDKAKAIYMMHKNNYNQVNEAEVEYEWNDNYVRRIIIASGGIPDKNYTFDSWYFYYDYDKPTFKIETQTFNLYVNEPFKSFLENVKTNIINWTKNNKDIEILNCNEDNICIKNTNYMIDLDFKNFRFIYHDFETGFNYSTEEPIDILFVLKEQLNLDFIGG